MKFEFSIRNAIKESWNMFKLAPWFFITLTLVMVVINIAGGEDVPFVLGLLGLAASIIMSYVWFSVALATVDGKIDLLVFKKFRTHLPSFYNFLMFCGVWLLGGLFTVLGLVALIIPGIYILVRLMFAKIAYVDRKGTIMQSLRYSWNMVKGDVFWTVFLTGLVSIGLMILGIILIGVGFLVLYPVAAFLVAKLYRTLTLHHEEHAIIVQPVEIAAHTEEVPAVTV